MLGSATPTIRRSQLSDGRAGSIRGQQLNEASPVELGAEVACFGIGQLPGGRAVAAARGDKILQRECVSRIRRDEPLPSFVQLVRWGTEDDHCPVGREVLDAGTVGKVQTDIGRFTDDRDGPSRFTCSLLARLTSPDFARLTEEHSAPGNVCGMPSQVSSSTSTSSRRRPRSVVSVHLVWPIRSRRHGLRARRRRARRSARPRS